MRYAERVSNGVHLPSKHSRAASALSSSSLYTAPVGLSLWRIGGDGRCMFRALVQGAHQLDKGGYHFVSTATTSRSKRTLQIQLAQHRANHCNGLRASAPKRCVQQLMMTGTLMVLEALQQIRSCCHILHCAKHVYTCMLYTLLATDECTTTFQLAHCVIYSAQPVQGTHKSHSRLLDICI